ncbi:MAG: RecQ family zinc-binding domain-containing protein [Acidobacteria bacterium]|nr:RecQ family zinc-binding domain-containing protein [Acidobacteriota bacterium]
MRVILALLKEMKLVRELRGCRFRLLDGGLERVELEELARLSEEKAAREREKLERMMQYGRSAACRRRLLLDYFGGEMEGERRGTCDNCLQPPDEQSVAAGVNHHAGSSHSGNGIPDRLSPCLRPCCRALRNSRPRKSGSLPVIRRYRRASAIWDGSSARPGR